MMKKHIFLGILLFMAQCIWPLPGPVYTLVSAGELPCLRCHKSKKAGKVVHPALEMGCSTCHLSPHEEEKPGLSLMSDPPGLCFNCHDQGGFTKKHQHTAVALGMCTSCHNPHSSNNENLLAADIPDLCYTCHDKGVFTKKTVHPPVASGQCSICHNPHSSDNMFNLENPVWDLCVTCHDDKSSGKHVIGGFGFGDMHPTRGIPDPVRDGRELSCTSCHNPHSSSLKHLFVNDTLSPDNLCSMCHKKITIQP